MGNTRPLRQPAAAPAGLPGQRPMSRVRRRLKRAAITLAVIIAAGVAGIAALWVTTPPASEATRLARAQAAQEGIAFPGPQVPASFARPLIATEDHRFYSEPGVDVLAVGRVVWAKLAGGADQGGATLEQQLAKLLYTPGRSGVNAELEQVVLAFKLNAAYSKSELLDLYAEAAYYGHGYYGLAQASCGYFGHPAADLSVTQGAMLAGVVNAPSLDDPVNDPVNARARLEHVIGRMVAVGYLTSAQAARALSVPLGLAPRSQPG